MIQPTVKGKTMRLSAPKPILMGAALLALFAAPALFPATALAGEPGRGFVPPVWTIFPFVGILLSIALFPLFAPHFWEHHYPKVSGFWLVLAVILMVFSVPENMRFSEAFGSHFFSTTEEYIAFIILLGSLFIISGGIFITGNFQGYPLVNTAILALGAVLASFIGTTGAAMLLIRPLIRANKSRSKQTHIYVFFIFIVCNVGGTLTPIGDPPLFLGFLQGIPFEWTLRLTPEWAFVNGMLLIYFYLIDRFQVTPSDFSPS
ncbi:MAG: sodium:proton antiporter, partial [Deltaproteobacteria bacterium]|nr:sodium:proton antiporter [Deltaproteobacteria bacterium]